MKPTKPIKPRERLKKRYYPVTKGGRSGPANKRAVLALVERGGKARIFHLATPDKATVTKIVRENIAKESSFHTDESRLYFGSDKHFVAHETVTHSHGEYVRDDVHSNTVQGVFSIFKRGNERHLSALRREAPSPLPRGI